jgi:hypothetical protein
VGQRAYTFCVLERLQDGLHRRDLFVAAPAPSERWGDPRAELLQGAAWEAARAQVCRTLELAPAPEGELTALAAMLDEAYRRTAANLPGNAAVRIERPADAGGAAGRDRLVLTGLDKLEEPASLVALREQVARRLPPVELPELLLELHLDERPVHRLPRHRRPRHAARLPLHPRRPAGAPDRAAAGGGDVGHRRLQRPRLRPLLAPGLPV